MFIVFPKDHNALFSGLTNIQNEQQEYFLSEAETSRDNRRDVELNWPVYITSLSPVIFPLWDFVTQVILLPQPLQVFEPSHLASATSLFSLSITNLISDLRI